MCPAVVQHLVMMCTNKSVVLWSVATSCEAYKAPKTRASLSHDYGHGYNIFVLLGLYCVYGNLVYTRDLIIIKYSFSECELFMYVTGSPHIEWALPRWACTRGIQKPWWTLSQPCQRPAAAFRSEGPWLRKMNPPRIERIERIQGQAQGKCFPLWGNYFP